MVLFKRLEAWQSHYSGQHLTAVRCAGIRQRAGSAYPFEELECKVSKKTYFYIFPNENPNV